MPKSCSWPKHFETLPEKTHVKVRSLTTLIHYDNYENVSYSLLVKNDRWEIKQN